MATGSSTRSGWRVLRHTWLVIPLGFAVFWIYLATAAASQTRAAAHLLDAHGRRVGTVTFRQLPGGDSRVTFRVHGLPPGFHAFHVHEVGRCDPANAFSSARGHFDKFDRAFPYDGDLPAILVNADHTGSGSTVTDRFEVGDVLGRSIAVQAAPDNFGNVPVGTGPTDFAPVSPRAASRARNTGDAGPIIACGVIRQTRR